MMDRNNQHSDQEIRNAPYTDTFVGRVLLVDDNASIRTMAGLYLQSLRYQVIEAVDGEDAVRKAGDAPSDLILMDLNLPGIDGLEATRRIRALSGDISRVPIIGITAADHTERRPSCLDVGMDDVIDKVSLLSALPGLIRRFVGRRASGEASFSPPRTIEPAEENANLNLAELNCRLDLIGRDGLARAFEGFSDQGQRLLPEMTLAWREGRHGDSAAIAHWLCGSAATFQMVGLRSVLAGLETALRRPDIDEIEVSKRLDQLTKAWSRSVGAFEHWLAACA